MACRWLETGYAGRLLLLGAPCSPPWAWLRLWFSHPAVTRELQPSGTSKRHPRQHFNRSGERLQWGRPGPYTVSVNSKSSSGLNPQPQEAGDRALSLMRLLCTLCTYAMRLASMLARCVEG
eukprot:2707258-Prymnesium_polylepis.1